MAVTMVTKGYQRPRYYSDGITKITDPLWTVQCPECGKSGWALTMTGKCQNCGSTSAVFTNPNIKIARPLH